MKKKMEYDQSDSRNTLSFSHTLAHPHKPTRMFTLYVFDLCLRHFHSGSSLWTFNACLCLVFFFYHSFHFISFTAGRSSIGQQRSVSFGSLNSWNFKIVSKQTCGSMILINFLDSLFFVFRLAEFTIEFGLGQFGGWPPSPSPPRQWYIYWLSERMHLLSTVAATAHLRSQI